ncbi:hypothetical protein E2C01_033804 [Portunus trituberculatus]|uniref:Uncharacterized protein n=1 Tax=Portunus trituberculatus TaxID=210409 RepID=A0A5B7F520_PORTR|nr:hypothetical protein [Portunus trituberculatus]
MSTEASCDHEIFFALNHRYKTPGRFRPPSTRFSGSSTSPQAAINLGHTLMEEAEAEEEKEKEEKEEEQEEDGSHTVADFSNNFSTILFSAALFPPSGAAGAERNDGRMWEDGG